MKKITLFALLITAGGSLLAQPTITQADFPGVGASWAKLDDTHAGAHTVNAGGANLTWDYSTGFFSITDTVFESLINPSAVPNGYGSNFPGSTLAQYSTIDSTANFFKVSSTGIYLDGFYSAKKNGFGKVDFVPDFLYVPAGFTYNSTVNNTARGVIMLKQGSVNIKVISRQVQNFTGDGYGTIKTPAGTFTNVLRIHTFTYAYDSTYADFTGTGNYSLVSSKGPKDSTDTYLWYSTTQKNVIASVEFKGPASKSKSDHASYYNYTLKNPNGIKEINTDKTVSVYPNPAVNQAVSFSFNSNSDAANLVIYNVTGELIRNEEVSGVNRFILQTNDLNGGVYFYNITDKTGATLKNGKFVVNHN